MSAELENESSLPVRIRDIEPGLVDLSPEGVLKINIPAVAALVKDPDDKVSMELSQARNHLDGTRKMLRRACEEIGDNNWEDDLHLADVVEKYLLCPALETIEDLEEEIKFLRKETNQ